MVSPEILINSLMLGVMLGGLYAVIGIGLSISFGVMKIVNLAHGDFLVLGCYFAYACLSFFGIDPILSLIILVPIFFALGLALQKFMLERSFKIDPNAPILLTFGISIILQNLYLLIWTPYSKALITSYMLMTLRIGKYNIPFIYLLDLLVALVALILLRAFLKKTYLGIAIRASSQSWRASQLVGINTSRVQAFAFGLALALSALSGVFVGLTLPFTPTSGTNYLLIAFGVLMIGGVGSMVGSFIGGIVMGLTQLLSGTFLGVGWQLFFTSIIILIALSIRTEKILGVKK
jgi:branched-chain amino acid transport system permease protein